jgi:hypothetical protein
MKLFKLLKSCVWMSAALLMAGCGGAQYASSDPVNPAQPFAFPGQSAPAYAGQSQPAPFGRAFARAPAGACPLHGRGGEPQRDVQSSSRRASS